MEFPRPLAYIFYPGSPFCRNNLTTPQAVNLTGTIGGTFSASPSGLNISVATGVYYPPRVFPGLIPLTYNVSGRGTATAATPVRILARPFATFSYPGIAPAANDSDPCRFFRVVVWQELSSTSGFGFLNINGGEVDLSASTPRHIR
ncbi:MAG: hypothetical protein IPI69_16085 [Bacteroidales bacterium]|nr:hypothetical protein [Bacteroidales bacterium]